MSISQHCNDSVRVVNSIHLYLVNCRPSSLTTVRPTRKPHFLFFYTSALLYLLTTPTTSKNLNLQPHLRNNNFLLRIAYSGPRLRTIFTLHQIRNTLSPFDNMASRIPNPIAGLLAINSKLFSPRGGALPKPPNAASYLRFELSLNSFTAVSEARLKLLIIASRPSGSHTSDYRASISFPADGLIDFIYTTPMSALEIPSIFNVPTSANINSFRCLTFAANDFFLNVAKVGVLHSPDVTIDLERLLNTVKNAILLPDAILDVQFLVCGSHGATDAAMLRIHKAMARVVSPAPAPALIEPAESAEPFEESDEGNLSGPNKVSSISMCHVHPLTPLGPFRRYVKQNLQEEDIYTK